MNARPDFSPQMLRGFLYARAVARDSFARNPNRARGEMVMALTKASGLPFSVVCAAFIGRPIDDAQRAALWAALGHLEVAPAAGRASNRTPCEARPAGGAGGEAAGTPHEAS